MAKSDSMVGQVGDTILPRYSPGGASLISSWQMGVGCG